MRAALATSAVLAAAAALAQQAAPPPVAPAGEDRADRLVERARQDREIVYWLRAPETHAFDLCHDLTETREGTERYLNVVRRGSTVRDPRAVVLDTGERLPVDTLRGDAIRRAGIEIGEPVQPDSEVVVVRFPKLLPGQSLRLRICETYLDPARYRLEGEELVFDRTFGRPHNALVLPAGYYLTNSGIPATVSEAADGRIRLDFTNPRPDEIAVLVTARKRPLRPAS